MTSWPTSTTPAPATGPPKPSTAESNTSAAQPLASEIYSTTSPEHSWTPADSEPKYTRFYDEPDNDDWSCYPDQETLAKVTAQGKRTVARHLKSLSELGLVLSESRYGAGRGRIGNMYYLVQDVQ